MLPQRSRTIDHVQKGRPQAGIGGNVLLPKDTEGCLGGETMNQ
jgi:hypothetical protein